MKFGGAPDTVRDRMRLILTLFAVLVLGCDRSSTEVVVQRVPKQPKPLMQAQMPVAADPHSPGASDGRPVHWNVPEGWKELPGSSMRFATIVVNDDPRVELTVVPLAGDSGTLLANVNRWEGQLGLKHSTEQELAKLVTRIEVDKRPCDLVELVGPEGTDARQRMLAASLPHEGRTWYFKMVGPDAIVAAQKDKFKSFIGSIHFHEAGQSEPASQPQAAVQTSGEITYTVPPGWNKAPDRAMRVSTLTVGAAPQQAEMIASKFPVNSGTVLENFNRWRGQVGMPPLAREDQQPTRPFAVGGADGIFVDLTGPQQRMLVAWVTRGGDWWFFKFTGPLAVVEKEQPSFESYLNSIQFAGDRGAIKP
jgi:hypothetical protein